MKALLTKKELLTLFKASKYYIRLYSAVTIPVTKSALTNTQFTHCQCLFNEQQIKEDKYINCNVIITEFVNITDN